MKGPSIPSLIIPAFVPVLIPHFQGLEQAVVCLTLLAVEHGGHLGFLSRGKARFWLDGTVLDWAEGNIKRPKHVS